MSGEKTKLHVLKKKKEEEEEEEEESKIRSITRT
jgi:hypothetical protein